MEQTVDGSVSRLLELGLPGIVIIALCYAVAILWKRNIILQEKLDLIQEKRIEISSDAVKALTNSAHAMEVLTETIRDRRTGTA